MRKLSKLFLLVCLAAPMTQAAEAGPGPGGDPETVTVCYFGNTVRVPLKIANRLMKAGAKMGACGQEKPAECPFGTISVHGICFPMDWVQTTRPTVERPADTEKASQLNQAIDAPSQTVLSLGNKEYVSR